LNQPCWRSTLPALSGAARGNPDPGHRGLKQWRGSRSPPSVPAEDRRIHLTPGCVPASSSRTETDRRSPSSPRRPLPATRPRSVRRVITRTC